eukprot:17681-Heterococcus_DN1.PRE.5
MTTPGASCSSSALCIAARVVVSPITRALFSTAACCRSFRSVTAAITPLCVSTASVSARACMTLSAHFQALQSCNRSLSVNCHNG